MRPYWAPGGPGTSRCGETGPAVLWCFLVSIA